MSPNRMTSVRLSPATDAKLQALRRLYNGSQSEVISTALERLYTAHFGQGAAPSAEEIEEGLESKSD